MGTFRFTLAVFFAKIVGRVALALRLGAGGTWPGEVALMVSPSILRSFSSQFKKGAIVVAGTNGKTTTSLMIKQILESQNYRIVHNSSGANLLNGVVSACITSSNWFGKIGADWGVFEVDENSLPLVISNLKTTKLILVLLNLFRDQLDRYGEVDVIVEKWQKALNQLNSTTLILNADDPLIAWLGSNRDSSTLLGMTKSIVYFGIEDKKYFLNKQEHATDSTFCLNCGARLNYTGVYFSHLGVWKCLECGQKRPRPDFSHAYCPLPGLYNQYNALAAVALAQLIDIQKSDIEKALNNFKPAFGRQEEFLIQGKTIKVFLSKNPTGFNASLRTVLAENPQALLLVLNDRIPDGWDVSWIWDVDFEMIPDNIPIIVSGDRVYDMALRIKYSQKSQIPNPKSQTKSKFLNVEPNLRLAIQKGLEKIEKGKTLYILPTYSAMLEVRKILIGRKIL